MKKVVTPRAEPPALTAFRTKYPDGTWKKGNSAVKVHGLWSRIPGAAPGERQRVSRVKKQLVASGVPFDEAQTLACCWLGASRFIESYLRVHGMGSAKTKEMTQRALERVGLVEAADRKDGGYPVLLLLT